MKKLLLIPVTLALSLVVIAQDTIPANKKITTGGQKAHLDYFLKLGGVDGEDPDSLPPSPGHLSISAGGTLSKTRNNNLIERYSVKSKPGFMISIGYAFEFPKSRLQISAGYQKGGVNVAAGDIDGDGKDNNTHVDLDYLSVPLQYHFYPGRNRRFFIGGGGYVSFLVSSKQRGTPVFANGFRKMDAGVIGSAGFWMSRRILIQPGYSIGFIDVDASATRKSARNGMAFLTISYSLTPKIKYGPIIKIKPKGG